MSATTANENKGITTTTSGHLAVNTAPDVCRFPAPPLPPNPQPNDVPTSRATTKTTNATLIHDGNVVRQGDKIGPQSDPGHSHTGAGGGVGSHTYRMEAVITAGSLNVRAEGEPVGRLGDPTQHNHGNTVGVIQGGSANSALANLLTERAKACTLDNTTVKCHGGKREAGDDKLLEVTAQDEVVLTAERKNAKDENLGPQCAQGGDHTKWTIVRRKAGKEEKRQDFNKDVVTLDNSWFTWGHLDSGGELDHEGQETETKIHQREDQPTPAKVKPKPFSKAKRKGGQSQSRVDKINAKRAADARNQANRANRANAANAPGPMHGPGAAAKNVIQVAKGLVSFKELIEVWFADQNPVEVTVEAFACTGAAAYTLRSYPGKNADFKFELNSSEGKRLKAAAASINRLFAGMKRFVELAGQRCEVKVLDEVEFLANCQWEEMDKDVAQIRKYKHHCDLGWEFDFNAKLAEIDIQFSIPIVTLLNLFWPGAGSLVNRISSALGFEARFNVDIKFKISAGVYGARDPGGIQAVVGGQLPVEMSIYINISLRWGRRFAISGGVVIDVSGPTFAIVCPGFNFFESYIAIRKGHIRFGVRAVVEIDLWFWSHDETWTYYPEWAKAEWNEYRICGFGALLA